MGKQKLTSKTYVHLPDGRVLPVSTVHDAGGAEMQIERHLPCEQWEQMVQKMMERAGEVMSDCYSAQMDSFSLNFFVEFCKNRRILRGQMRRNLVCSN